MPSPFPGMNPYLEQLSVWHDFHNAFAMHCRDTLTTGLLPDYIATIDDNIYIHELPYKEPRLLGRSDVSVAEAAAGSVGAVVAEAIEAPVVGQVLPRVDVVHENFVEIRDRVSRELVTVIELLSPTNKRPGSDRNLFLNKRHQLMRSTAHYVEIDLLRGEPRLPIDNLPECDSYVMVSRVEQRPNVGLWPTMLRESLPTIPIPLRAPSKDAQLDLQAVLHQTYDAAGYAAYIYSGEPEPPLVEEAAAWAQDLLAGDRIE